MKAAVDNGAETEVRIFFLIPLALSVYVKSGTPNKNFSALCLTTSLTPIKKISKIANFLHGCLAQILRISAAWDMC
jgi:hypothetical protein